jgi:hypothetical protein
MTRLQRGGVFRVPIRTGLGHTLERRHALARQRVRLHIRIDVAGLVEQLISHALESIVHAFRRLPGGGQEPHRGTVRLVLLRADIAEKRVLDGGLWTSDRCHAGLPQISIPASACGNHCADA